ncbi:hypothetical protein G3M48_003558 [Beauveria asiatica]|uniref:Uncharacterized protein n=1 Tax=Beauveria asiatica TaxID=1069075 RepID=A0AAW0RVE5_9HYPO
MENLNIPELTDIDGCRQDSALPELKKPDLALRIDLAAEVDETDRSAECCGIAQSPSVADIAACSTGSETDYTASRGSTTFLRTEEVNETQVHPPEVIDSTVSDDDGVRNRPECANRK